MSPPRAPVADLLQGFWRGRWRAPARVPRSVFPSAYPPERASVDRPRTDPSVIILRTGREHCPLTWYGALRARPPAHASPWPLAAACAAGRVALRRLRRCPRRPVPALVSGALPYQADPWSSSARGVGFPRRRPRRCPRGADASSSRHICRASLLSI